MSWDELEALGTKSERHGVTMSTMSTYRKIRGAILQIVAMGEVMEQKVCVRFPPGNIPRGGSRSWIECE